MNSPDQDDVDKKLRLAVPWVSDPEHQDLRDEETRRLQEDVIAAARRLERESGEFSPPSEPGTAVSFRIATRRVRIPVSGGESPEEAARRFFAQVRPEYVSPEQQRVGLSGMVMAAGLLGAMAVSAIVALVVVNLLQPPTLGADVTGEERGAKGNSFASATLGLAKVQEAQARMTPSDEPAAPAETLLASTAPNDVASPEPPAAASPQPAKAEPAQPEMATPAASPVPAATAAPEAPARALAQDETESLLKRGRDLIALGDIASARLVLTLVAEAGNSEASFILAGTYDPLVLGSLRAIGVQGDPAKARAWYARAAELGSQEARQRLQALR
jgi:hypothetical protein